MKVYSPFRSFTKKEKLEVCDALTESQFSIKETSKHKNREDFTLSQKKDKIKRG